MEHCEHCPGADDPRHDDPEFAAAEAACAFYENPANLAPAGPARRRRPRTTVSLRYDSPLYAPQNLTVNSAF